MLPQPAILSPLFAVIRPAHDWIERKARHTLTGGRFLIEVCRCASRRRRAIHTLHSTVGKAAHAADTWARPGEGAVAATPLGAFVRDVYAADCARFLADLKQRTAATEIADPPAAPARR